MAECKQPLGVSDVVWCSVGSSFPKWLCKIIGVDEKNTIDVESFGDHQISSLSMDKAIKFTSDTTTIDLIFKGRKKLKSRQGSLNLFNKSIAEAIKAVQECDPEFVLEDDITADLILKTEEPVEDKQQTTIATTTPSNTNTTRSGRTVKHLQTPNTGNGAPQSSEPKSKRRKINKKNLSPGKANSQSESEDVSSPPLDDLLQKSISRLSAKRKHPNGNTTDAALPASKRVAHNVVPLDELVTGNGNIVVNLSDQLKTSSPAPEPPSNPTEDKVVREQSILSDNSSCPILPSPATESLSDNEELPETCGLRNTELTFKDIKPNDVVWAKYQNYPFWPSVVDSVQCKKKSGTALTMQKSTRVKVYFLGVIDDPSKPFGIKLKKNIVSYNYLNTVKLTDEGRKSLKGKPFAKQFEKSVEEAEQLKKMRAENKISGTPREQIELMVKMRQPYIEDLRPDEKRRPTANIKKEMDESNTNGDDSELPSSSAFGYDISDTQRELFGNTDSSSDGEWLDQEEEESSQEDEESGLYGFDRIMKYCKKHKDLMVDISNGKVVSELHNVFFNGLRKDKRTMQMTGKFGPAKLSKSQQSEVLNYIQEVVKERFDGIRNFSYAYDVILPEIMTRLISETEGCSLEQAWERLN